MLADSAWWSCKVQTAVLHRSTEAEVVALDAGLRLNGIPALGLWDILIEVLEPHSQGDLMRHSKQKPQTSQSNDVKQTH